MKCQDFFENLFGCGLPVILAPHQEQLLLYSIFPESQIYFPYVKHKELKKENGCFKHPLPFRYKSHLLHPEPRRERVDM